MRTSGGTTVQPQLISGKLVWNLEDASPGKKPSCPWWDHLNSGFVGHIVAFFHRTKWSRNTLPSTRMQRRIPTCSWQDSPTRPYWHCFPCFCESSSITPGADKHLICGSLEVSTPYPRPDRGYTQELGNLKYMHRRTMTQYSEIAVNDWTCSPQFH